MYQVAIEGKKIGYVNLPNKIEEYIDETVNNESDKNIAFVNLKKVPALQLVLVNRDTEKQENKVKEEIAKQVSVEYTNYAISINGKNKTYVASMEEAEKIIKELNKEYDSKYTKNLGILQVYSNNYSKIASVSSKNAKKTIAKELTKAKQTDIKLAQSKKGIAIKNYNAVQMIKKETSVKGIKLSARPVSGTITSRFGRRSSPGGIGSTNHKGLDIAAPNGTSIYGTASGTVKFAGYKGSLGNLVIISHGNGVETYYGHCSKLVVSAGQKVNAGDKIAEVGKTGAATGYHLHFEIRNNGVSINPQKYIY